MGSHQDFTEGNISRAIVLLAVPMVLEMCMESLFGVVDVFWVSRLGADAVATVGLTETALTLVFVIALGLSMGATALVARRIGEKDERAAGLVAVQAIIIGLVVSATTAIFGYFFAPNLLHIMGGSDSVVKLGSGYTRMILSGSATIFLLFLINAVFRGAGDAAIAMRVLWIANIVNICLNPCLIFGLGPFPRLGVTGSAVGTTIGRGVGVLLQLWVLTSGRGRLAVHASQLQGGLSGHVAPHPAVVERHVPVHGANGQLDRHGAHHRQFRKRRHRRLHRRVQGDHLRDSSLLGHEQRRRHAGGTESGRGQTVARRDFGVADGTVQHAVPGHHRAAYSSLSRRRSSRLFTTDPAVAPLAVNALRLFSCGNVSYSYGMVITAAFNGAGDTATPTVLNLICFWLCQIPLAWALAFHTGLGPNGVYVAVVVSDSLLAAAWRHAVPPWKMEAG